jgi:hypothetical protein
MKKFLALGSLALLALCFSIPASADPIPFEKSLTFRNSANTVQGYADSAIACHSTTAADTTAPIPIWNWVLPQQTLTPTASDSLAWMTLEIFPAIQTGITASSDTVLLAVQVSENAVTWVNVLPPVNGGAMLNCIGISGSADTSFVCAAAVGAEDFPTTTNYHRFRWRTVTGGATAGGWNWQAAGLFPNYLQIWGHRFVRFILNTSDANGCWTGVVRGYAAPGSTAISGNSY